MNSINSWYSSRRLCKSYSKHLQFLPPLPLTVPTTFTTHGPYHLYHSQQIYCNK